MSVKIFKYIAKEVIGSMLIMTALLLIIVLVNRMLHFINFVAIGSLTMVTLGKVMIILVMLFLVHLLILSFYLSIIFVLGRLFVDYEMTVLQACGFSRMKLLGCVMILAAAISIIVTILVMYVEPMARANQQIVVGQGMAEVSLSKILPKRFKTIDKGNKMVYVHDATKLMPRTLYDTVVIQHTPESATSAESWDISTAKKTNEQSIKGSYAPFIVLAHGRRIVFTPGSLAVKISNYKKYGIRVDSPVFNIKMAAETLPTSVLWRHRHDSLLDLSVLYYRFSLIFAVFIFALMAIPLSYVAPRKGRYVKLVPAIIIFLLYINFILTTKNWIANGSAPLWLLWLWEPIVGLLIAVVLFLYGTGVPRGMAWYRGIRDLKRTQKKMVRHEED